MTACLAREETRCAMSTEEANRLLVRSDRRLRKVKEWIAYAEVTLERMYSIWHRLALIEKEAGELRNQIERDRT
jgi:hypothetical protein